MNLKYYWWVFPKAIPEDFCDKIIEEASKQKKQVAKIGDEGTKVIDNKEVRNSNIVWLTDGWIYEKIGPFIDAANKNASWNFNYFKTESMQFTIYNKEQHYDWHQDSFPVYSNINQPELFGLTRKVSAVVQLTDGKKFKGGDLVFDTRMYNPEKRDVHSAEVCLEARQKGTIVVFPSFLWHKVTPVTKGNRNTLVVWNCGYPFA